MQPFVRFVLLYGYTVSPNLLQIGTPDYARLCPS